jgi:hypothetical protein
MGSGRGRRVFLQCRWDCSGNVGWTGCCCGEGGRTGTVRMEILFVALVLGPFSSHHVGV